MKFGRPGRFWRNLPLGSKLATLASLLVVIVVLALTYLTVARERLSFRQELEDQAYLLLDTLPLTMRDQLYRLELDELADIASVVSASDNVTLFIIYDKKGAVLVDAAQEAPAFSQIVDPLGAELVASPRVHFEWQTSQLVAGRAIVLGSQTIGAIAIGLSTEPLTQKVVVLTRQSIWVAFGILLIGGSAAFLLARQITNPLGELAIVASQMAGGTFSTRVKIHSRDELGRLGEAFNTMAGAIQKREQELRDLAAGLERTVTTRTLELREQNEALVKANVELTLARQEAEAADRAKSAILSMVSHELRTPLTSILGFAKLIKRRVDRITLVDVVPEMHRTVRQIRTNVDIIVSEGDRLLALINNVLDLAKIESGKFEWHMHSLSVAAMIQQSIAATRALFETKDLDLMLDISENLPAIVADKDRLIQVMVNLISNAVKFTDAGAVTCAAYQKENEIIISVSDTGIGIDPHDYDKVFERFVQVGAQVQDAPQGTGLGLPICKEIVEHHGGRIWVESTLGEGSTFSFALPISPPASQDAKALVTG